MLSYIRETLKSLIKYINPWEVSHHCAWTGNMAAGQTGLWAAPENPVPSALYCEQKTAGNVLKHGDTIHLT